MIAFFSKLFGREPVAFDIETHRVAPDVEPTVCATAEHPQCPGSYTIVREPEGEHEAQIRMTARNRARIHEPAAATGIRSIEVPAPDDLATANATIASLRERIDELGDPDHLTRLEARTAAGERAVAELAELQRRFTDAAAESAATISNWETKYAEQAEDRESDRLNMRKDLCDANGKIGRMTARLRAVTGDWFQGEGETLANRVATEIDDARAELEHYRALNVRQREYIETLRLLVDGPDRST